MNSSVKQDSKIVYAIVITVALILIAMLLYNHLEQSLHLLGLTLILDEKVDAEDPHLQTLCICGY